MSSHEEIKTRLARVEAMYAEIKVMSDEADARDREARAAGNAYGIEHDEISYLSRIEYAMDNAMTDMKHALRFGGITS